VIVRSLHATLAATSLTLAVTALTLPAGAQEQPIGPPAPEQETPLEVRPSRPLEMAPAESGTSVWTKLGLSALVIAGAAAFYLKKRQPAPASKAPAIRIAARASIGVRSEILLVDVDGHRLVLGVTPSSVRTLSVLPADAEAAAEEASLAARFNESSIGSSFDRLLARTREEDLAETLRETVLPRKPPAAPRSTSRASVPSLAEEPGEKNRAVEGQVLSLARLKNKPKR
jgi:flagellar biogenesis protein FliO